MNEHPFLDTSNIPDWEELTPDHIRDDISKALENAESALEGIRQLNPTDTCLLLLPIPSRHLRRPAMSFIMLGFGDSLGCSMQLRSTKRGSQ